MAGDIIALTITLLIVIPLFWKVFTKLNKMDQQNWRNDE